MQTENKLLSQQYYYSSRRLQTYNMSYSSLKMNDAMTVTTKNSVNSPNRPMVQGRVISLQHGHCVTKTCRVFLHVHKCGAQAIQRSRVYFACEAFLTNVQLVLGYFGSFIINVSPFLGPVFITLGQFRSF